MVLLSSMQLEASLGPLSISQWLAEQTILSFVLPVVRAFIARPASFSLGNLIFLGEPELSGCHPRRLLPRQPFQDPLRGPFDRHGQQLHYRHFFCVSSTFSV